MPKRAIAVKKNTFKIPRIYGSNPSMAFSTAKTAPIVSLPEAEETVIGTETTNIPLPNVLSLT